MAGETKAMIRRAAHEARRLQPRKDAVSRLITDRFMAMPEYRRARRVLWYVDVRDEVRTRHALASVLAGSQRDDPGSDGPNENGLGESGPCESGPRVVVPYCVGETLDLFELRDWGELTPGAFGILEPRRELRGQERRGDPEAIDVVAVPGVAFDGAGGRIGHGRGFYDRLLAEVPETSVLVGLAFECQIFQRVPVDDHDVGMDWLVTEERTIRCL